MKKMGMKQTDIPATEVIIKTEDKEIIITNPQVSKINMMGQINFQISGEINEREKKVEIDISNEDIQTIIDQTSCSEEDAKSALEETGDLAEAIIKLSN